jgi:hypothetical protein
MKWMRLIRVLQAAQKKLDLTEKLLNELQERPYEPNPTDWPSANQKEDNTFSHDKLFVTYFLLF